MDPKIDIWNTLHDGMITVIAKKQSDLLMFVNIPFLRMRFSPLGDSFILRLKGFRSHKLLHWNGGARAFDLENGPILVGALITTTIERTLPVDIYTHMGNLVLDFEGLEITLDTGQSITFNQLHDAYSDFWREFQAKDKKQLDKPNQPPQTRTTSGPV